MVFVLCDTKALNFVSFVKQYFCRGTSACWFSAALRGGEAGGAWDWWLGLLIHNGLLQVSFSVQTNLQDV